MTRVPPAIVMILAALLVVRCGSAPSASPAPTRTGTTASPSAGQTRGSGATVLGQHVAAGALALSVPDDWHTRRPLPNPSGNIVLAYLGPAPIPSECHALANGGGVCHAWPSTHLGPGGILIAIRLYGMPGSRPPAGGDPIAVAGFPGSRITGPPDQGCAAIGGTQSIVIALPSVPDTLGWMSIDGCVAGGDSGAAGELFDAIVASAALAEQPSPSKGG